MGKPREHLEAKIREVYEAALPAGGLPARYQCLWWAYAACYVLRQRGYRAYVQAGSAWWPVLATASAPVESYQWGYQWPAAIDGAEMERALLGLQPLPQLHAWVGVVHRPQRSRPHNMELVDFTVGSLPARAAAAGWVWAGPQPPQVLWASRVPPGWVYVAQPLACKFAEGVVSQLMLGLEGKESTVGRVVATAQAAGQGGGL